MDILEDAEFAVEVVASVPCGVMRTGALLDVRVMTGTGAGAAAERDNGIDTGLDMTGALLEDRVCRNKLEEGALVEDDEDEDVLKLSRSEDAAGFFLGEISETEANSFPNRVRFCFTGGITRRRS